ncbi:MAG: hypothetical protein DRH57_07590 [Candidatus Cloacimonadota bacterium]|nr:MAG: hypothetical protein DRH57_07590 [Candidatus Cloacimonadota bacterium]
MTIEIQKEWFSLEQCLENPNKLYVFGDNMIRRGKGGQASIREAANSIGLATKRLPSMSVASFFSDKEDEYCIVEEDIEKILSEMQKDLRYDTLVLPFDGLGTGLSQMPEKSPELFEHMVTIIEDKLNITYRQ